MHQQVPKNCELLIVQVAAMRLQEDCQRLPFLGSGIAAAQGASLLVVLFYFCFIFISIVLGFMSKIKLQVAQDIGGYLADAIAGPGEGTAAVAVAYAAVGVARRLTKILAVALSNHDLYTLVYKESRGISVLVQAARGKALHKQPQSKGCQEQNEYTRICAVLDVSSSGISVEQGL